MTALRDARPMGTFDPCREACLHESLTDHVIVWNPACADDWHRTANPHAESVHWNGHVFDAWGTEIRPGATKPAPLS